MTLALALRIESAQGPPSARAFLRGSPAGGVRGRKVRGHRSPRRTRSSGRAARRLNRCGTPACSRPQARVPRRPNGVPRFRSGDHGRRTPVEFETPIRSELPSDPASRRGRLVYRLPGSPLAAGWPETPQNPSGLAIRAPRAGALSVRGRFRGWWSGHHVSRDAGSEMLSNSRLLWLTGRAG